MKETLITFETAKLAKEKKFDVPVKKAYHQYKGYSDMKVNSFKIGKSNHNALNGNCYNTSAPTQSLLQKWLRELHHINIQNHFLNKKYAVKIKYGNNISKNIYNKDTYEEALEEALQEALKLI